MRLPGLLFPLALAAGLAAAPAFADPIRIVAAENVYGDMAATVGGPHVAVTSILNSPDQDPHLFEANVAAARAIGQARIVILNGLDYDPWMEKLIKASVAPGRKEIVVGKLASRAAGDNPHIWYDPAAMETAARALAAELAAADPANGADYHAGYARFTRELKPLKDKLAAMRKAYAGQPAIASEPVFGYQAALLGLDLRGQRFAFAVMNNAEPSASDVAAFEDDLRGRKVKVMLYNAQASEPSVRRLVQIARDSGVPVVGVSETEPPGTTYAAWMLGQLDALDHALAGPTQ